MSDGSEDLDYDTAFHEEELSESMDDISREPFKVPDPPADYSSMTVEERIEIINSITASLFKEKMVIELNCLLETMKKIATKYGFDVKKEVKGLFVVQEKGREGKIEG